MRTKIQVDDIVALRLNEKPEKVRRITATFFDVLMDTLVEVDSVNIPKFGRFKLKASRGTRLGVEYLTRGNGVKGFSGKSFRVEVKTRYRVFFKRANAFRKKIIAKFGKPPILEDNMEKLGVDESVDQETLEKRANEGCPSCGAKVEKHGRVLACPNCGTEPFEKAR